MSDYDEFNKAIALAKEKNVANTVAFLNQNKIQFSESKNYNIVKINLKGRNMFLSLKKLHGNLKYRFAGSNEWITISKKDFLKMFL